MEPLLTLVMKTAEGIMTIPYRSVTGVSFKDSTSRTVSKKVGYFGNWEYVTETQTNHYVMDVSVGKYENYRMTFDFIEQWERVRLEWFAWLQTQHKSIAIFDPLDLMKTKVSSLLTATPRKV